MPGALTGVWSCYFDFSVCKTWPNSFHSRFYAPCFYTTSQGCMRNSKPICPCLPAHRFPVKCDIHVPPCISGLLQRRCPITVVLEVAQVVIFSLQHRSFLGDSHIVQKIDELVPFIANRNTARPIILVVHTGRNKATPLH